jgi:hypothetical protein
MIDCLTKNAPTISQSASVKYGNTALINGEQKGTFTLTIEND